MADIWIVHRDPHWRDALRSLAGSNEVLVGHPSDAVCFAHADAPRAVLLGVAGDFEAELEFAHRHAARLDTAAWVVLARPLDLPEARRLFDALGAAIVPIARDAATLRGRLRAALVRRAAPPLTERGRRDAITTRFATWFGDLDLPELLAAADPARAGLPLLVRGEPGTGRSLVARYLHIASAHDAQSPFFVVACDAETDVRAAIAALAPESGAVPTARTATICIEDADRLGCAGQQQLRSFVEHGLPAGLVHARSVRWIATAGDLPDALDPALEQAFAGLLVRVPPLRARPGAQDAMLRFTGREFTPEAIAHLRAHPWPCNLREFDALLRRTLAAKPVGAIGPEDLHFEPAILEMSSDAPDARAEPRAPVTHSPPAPVSSDPEPSEEAAAPAGPAPAFQQAAPLRRLSAAIAHEVGNPLVGIRTYAAMLPGRFDDAEFRAQFAERVEADTRRIESVVETLARLGGFPQPSRESVDVSSLIAKLLEYERPRIRERRLVVLEELERTQPNARGDADQLRFAFGYLIEQALGWVPARGDLYVSTRHVPATPARPAMLRVTLRLHGSGDGLGFAEHSLAVSALEEVVLAHGGTLSVEAAPTGETVLTAELLAL